MRWIFLRGLVREQRHWGNFLDVFAEKLTLPRQDLIALDFPGIGTEVGKAFPSSLKELVDGLRKRAHLEAGEKVGLFSMSLGSMCALEWCVSWPREIAGAVLVNTSAADLSSWNQRLTWVALKAFGQVLQIVDPYERERIILKLTSNLKANDLERARAWATWAPQKKELVALAARQLWVAARFRAPAHIASPALILSSSQDRLANPQCSALLASRYGLDNHVHLEAGHDLVLDDPEWVIQKTREWMERSLRGT